MTGEQGAATAVGTQLDTLEAKGLIRLATFRPELEYLFRHWLVQDAAYESLLKQERRELHRLVGEALETLYPERRSELGAILAMHFEQAGDAEKAIEYLVVAGRYALERNAIREAFSAFDRALGLLPPATPDDSEALRRRRVEIATGRSRAGFAFQGMTEQVEQLEAILPEAERLGDPELLAPIHLGLALSRLMGGTATTDPEVRRSLERVTEIGKRLKDPSLAALPLALVGLAQVFNGPIRDGVAKLEQAVPLLQQRHDAIGAAFARGALAIGYGNLGEFDKAEAAARNATEIAAGGDLIAQLDALIAVAWVASARGRLDEAIPTAQACVTRAEETGATACVVASSWVLGDAYARQGRFGEAKLALQRGHDIAAVVDRKGWRPTLRAWLGTTDAALGAMAAPEEWEEALATARSIGNRVGESGILLKRAEALARTQAWDAAVADFAASAAIAEELGVRPSLARVYRGWGEALRAMGRAAEGDEKLRAALALFEELSIEREAGEVREELAAAPVA
jgi:tetratricopeptide (TPR) repeat protein